VFAARPDPAVVSRSGRHLAGVLAGRPGGPGAVPGRVLGHAVWRAVVLVLLGVFLRSVGRPQTNWTFEDTLTQIGLGYVPLVLIAFGPRRLWWAAFAAILVGYWAVFALWPMPETRLRLGGRRGGGRLAAPAGGFAAHWNKNGNPAWAFDRGS
jgi:predicted acyltransferase